MQKLFKNPYVNSVLAEAYIVIVATVMQYVGKPDTPDNFFTPIAALSLFVLSASVMGFLFVGQPLQLYIDGEKSKSVSFFLKTVLSFALLTVLAWTLLSFSNR